MNRNLGAGLPAGYPGEPGRKPAPDAIRVSDAERDKVINELSERYGEGRLSYDTFQLRIEAAMKARSRRDLAALVADLPSGNRLRAAVAGRWQRARAAVAGAMSPALRPTSLPVLQFPSGEQCEFTIGRDQACDMVLPDPTVSRWHAGLKRDAGGWMLDDLGSTNGTRVNGWRVRARVPVRDGDLVSFGAVTFVVGSAGVARGLATAGGSPSR